MQGRDCRIFWTATTGGLRGNCKPLAGALAGNTSIGLIGHGITEVFPDGSQHVQLLKDVPRLRIDSETGARAFRLRKSFLGTSRMTMRAAVLRQIGRVPEALTIEADEYLFTLTGFLSDVLILGESLTFYRLHAGNAFQVPMETNKLSGANRRYSNR